MIPSPQPFLLSLLAGVLAVMPVSRAAAAEPTRIVLQNGRAIDISQLSLQGANFVVKAATDGFTAGQNLPIATADHVYGDKPSDLNPAIALLLTGKASDALKLLEPIIVSQRITAKVPGNYWLEAARAALVAYALGGDSTKCTDIGKEISDATPAPGTDPFVSLGKVLMLPSSTKVADRETALRDLTTDNLPADICAYASFYRGELLKGAKRNQDAMEAYLMVPCLFPAGGMILNAVAEMNASEQLTALGRREEAVALLKSSVLQSAGTLVAAEANKRLASLN